MNGHGKNYKMKAKLFKTKPKRIFTFGCSYTGYHWGTWANILGVEFESAQFYNYGQSGAGNMYISNTITQADCLHKFTKNDLVIVMWTNVSREDRFIEENNEWMLPGNIYSQGDYSEEFVKRYANEVYFKLRDYSLIKLTESLLQNKTQFHFLSMCNIAHTVDQWRDVTNKETKVTDIYKNVLSNILPSVYEVLYDNKIYLKLEQEREDVSPYFRDGHPFPHEYLKFLNLTFDYKFSDRTLKVVEDTSKSLISYLKKESTTEFYVKNKGFEKDVLMYLKKTYNMRGNNRHIEAITYKS